MSAGSLRGVMTPGTVGVMTQTQSIKPIRDLLKEIEAEAIEARMVNLSTGRGGERAALLEEFVGRLDNAIKKGRKS